MRIVQGWIGFGIQAKCLCSFYSGEDKTLPLTMTVLLGSGKGLPVSLLYH